MVSPEDIQTSPATPESCQIRGKTKFQQIILASKTADVDDLELFYASEPKERCSLTIAEKADTQIDDWELIDASEIPSLPLTGQGRIDFAHLSHEQCDRVDWITAFATVGPYLDQIQLIEKRMKRYMQVLAYADYPMMFLKYESFFLTALDGLAGAKPTLYRQRYVNAFCELKQYLPELKLRICRSWETNPCLTDVINDLKRLGASFIYVTDPFELLLNSAPALTKASSVTSEPSPKNTPIAESNQQTTAQPCPPETDPRTQRWISQRAPFQVAHYDTGAPMHEAVTIAENLDEKSCPTESPALEPSNQQVDEINVPQTDLHQRIPFDDEDPDDEDAPDAIEYSVLHRTVSFDEDDLAKERFLTESTSTNDAPAAPRKQKRKKKTHSFASHIEHHDDLDELPETSEPSNQQVDVTNAPHPGLCRQITFDDDASDVIDDSAPHRTVPFNDDSLAQERISIQRAKTPEALLDTDNTENQDIVQLFHSVETIIDEELRHFSSDCDTLEDQIQAAQRKTDHDCELYDHNVPITELLLQLRQLLLQLRQTAIPNHPSCKPSDPLDPDAPRADPPQPGPNNFPTGLAEQIKSFSRHTLRPAYATNKRLQGSTSSNPICPDSEPAGRVPQDHDGVDANVTSPATSTSITIPTDATTIDITAPRLSKENHLACNDSGPLDHGPRARNHRRNIRRRIKRKAARLSMKRSGLGAPPRARPRGRTRPPKDSTSSNDLDNQQTVKAKKKTHAMSSETTNNWVQHLKKKASKPSGTSNQVQHLKKKASKPSGTSNPVQHLKKKASNPSGTSHQVQLPKKKASKPSGTSNQVQLLKKKASKSSGTRIYYAGYTTLPEERVNELFQDEQHNGQVVLAEKKTHMMPSEMAHHQAELFKKKTDKSSGMEIYYSGSTHLFEERVHTLFRDELRLTALGQCALSNWLQPASNPT